MKYPIDISVYSPNRSVGMISGELELVTLPRIGETISFGSGKPAVPIPTVHQFSWQLRVAHVLHPANGGRTMLALEDLNAASEVDARAIMAYLEQAFDLFADYFDGEQESTAR